jgi:uncharacterized membrane protein YdjX (TVP38/TMEM64 family)
VKDDSNAPDGSGEEGLSGGAIAGIVVGVIIAIGAVVGALLYFLVIRKGGESDQEPAV